ncbi:putative kinase inhibitor [Frankia sp. AiPs1]|uniref:YbhB/YbcL family Raf kinase inhibitor-like protein n=1 Tax=Frankia sp. AiPa1 TaxID=573492 RepID=UPI00202B10E7|nr:YbhB/YbcL family Raf kinase inhibitor-like protein [Frankia sp. AiPa1]MCL9760733.1 YbhB/YbcL family Raf kinase inhibitor-like protein [Frankia sp. AiPa1]
MSLLERGTPPDPYDVLPVRPLFTVTSSDLVDGGTVPLAQVHDSAGGQNLSPSLAWSGAPAGTQSYVVTAFDPDAPTGSGFWHWVLVDLPATATELPAGAGSGDFPGLPAGAYHIRADWGTKEYGGAAPPQGDVPHRYVFTVHALDIPKLEINDEVSAAVVGFNLVFHTLARAVLRVTYQH